MRVRSWVSIGWLVLVGCGGPSEPDRAAPQSFAGRGFTATVRKDVLHNAVTPEPGVTLYDFHIGSQPILFLYLGDRPGYPRYTWKPQQEQDETLPSGLRAHCRAARSDGAHARECLITLATRSPRQLHAFYDKLTPEWAAVSDAIIQSLAAGPQ